MLTFATINKKNQLCLVYKNVVYSLDVVPTSEYVFSLVSKPIDNNIYIAIGTKDKFYRLKFRVNDKKLELSYTLDASRYEFHKSKINPNKDKIYICEVIEYQYKYTHQISFPYFLVDLKLKNLTSEQDYTTDYYSICMTGKYIICRGLSYEDYTIISYNPAIIKLDGKFYKIIKGIHSGKYLDGLTKEISIPDGI